MKTSFAGCVLLTLTSFSPGISAAEPAAITVYVNVELADASLLPFPAESMASRMFAKAGVRIQWRRDRPKRTESHALVVDITSATPAAFHPGALAYAYAYEGVHIRILWDRVKNVSANRGLLPKLLAHVMVHEITHVLQRTNRHSETGVMKAHWTDDDLLRMSLKPLPFESADIQLIHTGLAARSGAFQSARAEPPVAAQRAGR